jgi:acetate kinase
MQRGILILNAGSSSLKFSLYSRRDAGLQLLARGRVEALLTRPKFKVEDSKGRSLSSCEWETGAKPDHARALAHIQQWIEQRYGAELQLDAVGHRVVHGGMQFAAPMHIDAASLEQLDRLIPLAPLHQPHNLMPIRDYLMRSPTLPQIACFDTAFHRSQPELAQRFALPPQYWQEGIRRYGFHGISYEYIASVLNRLDPLSAAAKTIVLHLGTGASLCAMRDGRSIATTMSFTALDGIPMGTRCGAIDPGVLLYLMRNHGMDAGALEDLLYHHSGLLGVSGIASDMRKLESSEAPAAKLAIDLFVYRIALEIGSLAAAMQGVEALIFTGGIGENRASIRARICADAAWLGVQLDEQANVDNAALISLPQSSVSVRVVPTDEEEMIAQHTEAWLQQQSTH